MAVTVSEAPDDPPAVPGSRGRRPSFGVTDQNAGQQSAYLGRMDSDRSKDGSAGAPVVKDNTLVVKDNTVEDHFELFAGGMPAGVLAYRMQGEDYALIHTEVAPEFEGRGMGSALISRSLDQIREKGHGVVPVCPFVSSFLQRHPEYLDMVSARDRERFDLPSA